MSDHYQGVYFLENYESKDYTYVVLSPHSRQLYPQHNVQKCQCWEYHVMDHLWVADNEGRWTINGFIHWRVISRLVSSRWKNWQCYKLYTFSKEYWRLSRVSIVCVSPTMWSIEEKGQSPADNGGLTLATNWRVTVKLSNFLGKMAYNEAPLHSKCHII